MTSRRAARRERILREARQRFAKGERPTVETMAAAAGVSRPTFYRLVGSRAALLRSLEIEPDPQARERILAAALELIGTHGVSRISVDELAQKAAVSRATLYRLFPGKPALFRELLRTYSPLEPVAEIVERMRDRPPEVVIPAVARAAYEVVAPRVGVLRTFFFEVAAMDPDTEEAARYAIGRLLGGFAAYVIDQMKAGRLRPMHPVLALQSFIGPIFMHMITRPLAEGAMGLDVPPETAVDQLAQNWLRAMRPDGVS